MAPSPRFTVLAELDAAERMYDGPIPADLRAHILAGGRAQLTKLPVTQARDRVRRCLAEVRLAEPARPGREWQAARARRWLAGALTAYRHAQGRARREAQPAVRRNPQPPMR